ncbi:MULTISPECIES: glucuronate isomerase [unclassified Sphingobium]|uniref:glucuronate isomerase n=1 Tax=unclassified Sphingobium TaxID=2611147 RepID=UPI000D17BB69|nr:MULTISPECIES: glucuronate isomerase [unclassified Sphingobium]MBG6119771.1 glucuronate isomerase [Sphingobium sp. JAI105]PSO10599.1 glucuronate isomerase [Sphingobium sp. AEW4]TWD01198.1 glucuronate isomerase [Sphingobium sp. AEW010]TWD19932.1 glucuronate isomerase [Sphingobium sp. AEW013]TWD22548.1 glucuronate isomerase [Sphingobium sp. AEW001]
MANILDLHPDRLLPAEPATRLIARQLYDSVASLPIVSPHGHTDPAWFAKNEAFGDATDLLLKPDHYIFRMLYSQGIPLEALGIGDSLADPREAWRLFASHYHLFRGTPSRMWLDWVFAAVFGMKVQFGAATSDLYYDSITESLASEAFRPRALFDRFGIEVIATTEGPLDTLDHHAAIRAENRKADGWQGKVITAYRPDAVIDPEFEGFTANLGRLSDLTGKDCFTWSGYLAAHRQRRAFFAEMGATSSDHGHATPRTANLPPDEAASLFAKIVSGMFDMHDAELFRAQMLTEMAGMSVDDGLVMQIHPGSFRNHNASLFARFGRDKGADIPMRTEFVANLKPLLDRFGNDPRLSIILFTLDESVYARELAPLAGHYPCLKLGPAWWFHDSPEGMRRFRHMTTETAGFYNTVGFNDDTRAFLSIPARHDVARRIDCGFLAQLVVEHRLADWEAAELARDLTYNLVKTAYRL